MNQNNSSNSEVKVRDNIEGYVSCTPDGSLYLNKAPVPFDENGKYVSQENERVLDLAVLLTEIGLESPVEPNLFFQVCELLLLREEASPGSVFGGEK